MTLHKPTPCTRTTLYPRKGFITRRDLRSPGKIPGVPSDKKIDAYRGVTLHSSFSIVEDLSKPLKHNSTSGLFDDDRTPRFCVNRLVVASRDHEAGVGAVSLASESYRLISEPNAGGGSAVSEAMSLEIMRTLFGARLWQTEMEVRYWPPCSKKTDYIMTLPRCGFSDPVDIAVSVTRAFAFRDHFTRSRADQLLRQKLQGVNESSTCIIGREGVCRPIRQILHCFAPTVKTAAILRVAWLQLKKEYRRNTIIIVTVAPTWWIYVSSRVKDTWQTIRTNQQGSRRKKANTYHQAGKMASTRG